MTHTTVTVSMYGCRNLADTIVDCVLEICTTAVYAHISSVFAYLVQLVSIPTCALFRYCDLYNYLRKRLVCFTSDWLGITSQGHRQVGARSTSRFLAFL